MTANVVDNFEMLALSIAYDRRESYLIDRYKFAPMLL